jgi:predicted SAM-dependent methyltransferase
VRVNLAAGAKPKEGWVNLDLVQQDGIDMVHDLDVFPWPFEDGSVSDIEAHDIFEHVVDPLKFMAECHRILKTGRYLHIHTTYAPNLNSFTDPTHKRFCTEQTWDYWVPDTFFYKGYGKAYGGHDHPFEKVDVHVGEDNYLDATLKKM